MWHAITLVPAIALAFAAASLVGVLLVRLRVLHPPRGERIGNVDGLRGYLALSVMVHHFIVWTGIARLGRDWEAPAGAWLNEMGAGAVALFFMITGLVFYPWVLRGFSGRGFRTLLITRIFRIVPLIAVSVAVVIALQAARGLTFTQTVDHSAPLQWLAAWAEPNLLGAPDSGRVNAYVLWSLYYEWVFYLLVLPACALAMRLAYRFRLPSAVVPLGLLGVAGAWRIVSKTIGEPSGIATYLPLFACGMLAFELSRVERVRRVLSSRPAAAAGLSALVAAMTLFAYPYGAAMPLFWLFFLCVACGNSLFGLLDRPGALALGDASYGIYLLHGILLSILFTEGRAVIGSLELAVLPAVLVLAAAAIALIAGVGYRVIERPMIALGKRIARGASSEAVALPREEVQVAP